MGLEKKVKKMKIVLSAHIDLNKPVKYIKVSKNGIEGLVDNIAGVLSAYDALKELDVELFLTNFEEVDMSGAVKLAKDMKKQKEIIFIVVDTCTDTKGKKAYIGNAYGVNIDLLKKPFSEIIRFVDGYFEPDMDETAIYGADYKYPTFFFGIPIRNGYHDVNNKVSLKTINEATEVLVSVVSWIKKNKSKFLKG